MIKNILGRIWAVWGALVFIPTLLIAVIPIWLSNFIKEPTGTEVFRKVSNIWMRIFLTLIGCRISIKGREHFAKGENYIVVCNHNSYMDIPLTTPFIPGANKTIAKAELAKVPLFGIIYQRGSILVDRKSEKSRKDSIRKMKEVLQQGLHMCIYPEGTRNKSDAPIGPFHDGAFRLAIDTRKTIIPTLIFNTRKVLPGSSKPFFLWPAHLKMFFLAPVMVQPDDTVASLKERVHTIMYHFAEQQLKTS